MDVSQYLEIFIDESEEHLQTLSDCIMVLEKEPDNKDTINEVFRAAHSLKGMAGTMGFKRMQHLTHDMEALYRYLTYEWCHYLNYLSKNYPGLFSTAIMLSPFNKKHQRQALEDHKGGAC